MIKWLFNNFFPKRLNQTQNYSGIHSTQAALTLTKQSFVWQSH